MVYPLIFPFGGSGWSPYIESQNSENSSNISALQYYNSILRYECDKVLLCTSALCDFTIQRGLSAQLSSSALARVL